MIDHEDELGADPYLLLRKGEGLLGLMPCRVELPVGLLELGGVDPEQVRLQCQPPVAPGRPGVTDEDCDSEDGEETPEAEELDRSRGDLPRPAPSPQELGDVVVEQHRPVPIER